MSSKLPPEDFEMRCADVVQLFWQPELLGQAARKAIAVLYCFRD